MHIVYATHNNETNLIQALLRRVKQRKLLVIAGALWFLLTFFAVTTVNAQSAHATSWYDPRPGDHKPLLMAHQGGEGEAPSNTRVAFDKSMAAGAEVLDTDFHMTKDGVLVLFHDETLEFRTNGSGAVRDKTWAELQQLDFAYKWSPDGGKTFPYRGKGVGAMRMEEFFKRYPNKRLGIEIKQVNPQAVFRFCVLIKAYHSEDRVLVSSFAQDNMNTFRAICPKVATSATTDEATKFVLLQKQGLAHTYVNPPFSSLQLPEFQGTIPVLTKELVQAAHNHPSKLKVYAWTINTPEEWKHFADMGVDGINTNNPKKITETIFKK